jgi:hypothetical protein
MGSKPSAPKPLNVQKVAAEQNTQNQTNLGQQTAYNRPDQTNQYGSSLNWSQTGTDANGNPIFSQTQSLGGQGQQFAQGFSGLGQQYIQGAGDFVNNRPDLSSNAAFDRAYDYASANLEPRLQRGQDQMDTKLRNQGLDPSSEAYKNSMNDLALQNNEARNNLVTGLQGQMFNQGLQDRGQQASELSLLNPGVQYGANTISGGFAAVPNVNVPNVDLTSLEAQRQQQLNANYQSQMQQYNAMMGGLAGMGGMALGGALGGPMGAAMGSRLFGGGTTSPGTLANGGWSTTLNRS